MKSEFALAVRYCPGGVRFVVFFVYLLLGYGFAEAQPPDSVWSRIYDRSFYDGFGDIEQTADSGFIIVGSTRNDSSGVDCCEGWIIKTDTMGDTIWTRIYGGPRSDYLTRVRQLPDGGFIISGTTWSENDTIGKLWLLRTSDIGDLLWSRTYVHRNMQCYGLELLPDGGFMLAGSGTTPTAADPDSGDAWLLRTDANGDSLWMRIFVTGPETSFFAMDALSDGSFILAGQATLPGSYDWDGLLLKIDASGDTSWMRTRGGDGNTSTG